MFAGTWGPAWSPTPCPVGHYCPRGTKLPTQFQCPPGTWSKRTGLTEGEECAPCPRGWFCVGGAAVPSGMCPAGHYCPEGECGRVHPGSVTGECWELKPLTPSQPTPSRLRLDLRETSWGRLGLPCQRASQGFRAKPRPSLVLGEWHPCSRPLPQWPPSRTPPHQGGGEHLRWLRPPLTPALFSVSGTKWGTQFPCPAGTYSSQAGNSRVGDCLPCPAGAFCPSGTPTPVLCPR